VGILNRYLLEHGLAKTLFVISFLSIVLSVILTYTSIGLIYGLPQEDMPDYLLIGALVPAIIAPIMSFGMLNLILKINKLEKETQLLAKTDSLTGLYNHRAVYEHIQQALDEDKASCLLIADIDGFKAVNDTYGHLAGDLALKHIANIIKECLRSNDIVGRIGGDEFIICLPNTSRDDALLLGNRVLESVKNSDFIYDSNIIKLSVSFGLSSIDELTANKENIVKYADQALNRAKKSGKNVIAE
jgi:diguanylate cyclase (GGDEF)-like protein